MPLDIIYVVHHTHTDVGFTNDQPIFWELQYRFIDDALHLIDRYAGNPPESRFRWTVETTCGLDAWLKTASGREIDRLLAADRAGLLEVMAMQTNSTPLLDTASTPGARTPPPTSRSLRTHWRWITTKSTWRTRPAR